MYPLVLELCRDRRAPVRVPVAVTCRVLGFSTQGRIVGYSIGSRMKSSLAVAALRNAVALRCPMGTIVHSDRGSQFRSRKLIKALKDACLVGSMGPSQHAQTTPPWSRSLP